MISHKSKDTEKVLKKRLASFGDAELCCQEGEQLLKEGRPENALRFFQKAVKLDSNSMHGWFGQGMALTNMEEYAESLVYFRKVIKLGPKLLYHIRALYLECLSALSLMIALPD